MKHVAVITVNFHNESETIECIKSFSRIDIKGIKLEFFIVDNESTDKSLSTLAGHLPNTHIICSPQNLGFAGGCNLAIKKALENKTDNILLINPDSYIENRNFLQDLLMANKDIVSPVIKYKKNGKTLYDQGGVVDWLFGRNTHIVTQSNKPVQKKPSYFTGACLLIKNKVLKKIKGLDEGYFLYYEDADFCLRAVNAGFTMALCHKAILFHHLSTTTSKLGTKKLKILANSHLRFCLRHLPFYTFPLYIAFNLYLRFKSFYPKKQQS